MDRSESTDRRARIARIRQQIAAGTYETTEKLASALDAFLDDHQAGLLTPGADRVSPSDLPR